MLLYLPFLLYSNHEIETQSSSTKNWLRARSKCRSPRTRRLTCTYPSCDGTKWSWGSSCPRLSNIIVRAPHSKNKVQEKQQRNRRVQLVRLRYLYGCLCKRCNSPKTSALQTHISRLMPHEVARWTYTARSLEVSWVQRGYHSNYSWECNKRSRAWETKTATQWWYFRVFYELKRKQRQSS